MEVNSSPVIPFPKFLIFPTPLSSYLTLGILFSFFLTPLFCVNIYLLNPNSLLPLTRYRSIVLALFDRLTQLVYLR